MQPIEIVVIIGAILLVVGSIIYNILKKKKGKVSSCCNGNCNGCKGCK